MTIFPFKNKNVLVVGLGKSGVAAAQLLAKQLAHVYVTEKKERKDVQPFVHALPKHVNVETGGHTFFKKSFDLIVVSPGIPWDLPFFNQCRRQNIPVWSELELGWRFVPPANAEKTVAVTGTNGKTTTTALIAHLLSSAKKDVVVGGNIGTPLCSLIDQLTTKSYVVLEVSSYQLEGHQTFHPHVGVLMNLTPDHLARHKTMKNYAAMKKRLLLNMIHDDAVVYNRKDKWCRWMVEKTKATKCGFPNRMAQSLAKLIRLPGDHNLQNAMAAAEVCVKLGMSTRTILRGMKSFQGVPHRIELIRELRGVRYVNDSKATNVDSTAVALKSFSGPLVLIVGGEHKGTAYSSLIPLMKNKVKMVLTIGEAASLIKKDLKNQFPLEHCQTLEKAVARSHQIAVSGDVVLLSPACASFDQFKNFEHRGETFSKLVRALRA